MHIALRVRGSFLACSLLIGGTSAQVESATAPITGAPVEFIPTAGSTVRMTYANDIAGLGDIHTEGNSHTGGCAWVDYNNDLLPDLFVTNGGGFEHFLFRNEGDGSFTDVSFLVPKPDIGLEDASVACADIDNDGDTDILVAVDRNEFMNAQLVQNEEGGPNLLYVNQGDGTFLEEAQARGLVDPRGWRNIFGSFEDFDRDGLVDVYLGMWALNTGLNNKSDRLMRNTGAGMFVREAEGANSLGRDTLAMLWFDADMDNLPELMVGVPNPNGHFPPANICTDVFYRNDGGGRLTEVALSVGLGQDTCAPMGMDVGDIDNDGDWDLYITDLYGGLPAPLGNPLYLGNGDGTFGGNVADLAGVQAGDSWACNFADFNRDMWVDLWVGELNGPRQDYLFLNNKDNTFSEQVVPSWGGGRTRGGSIADYDGDGDVDVFMQNYSPGGLYPGSALFRNDSLDQHNYVSVKLFGVTSNRDAIGALVRVTAGGITQMRRVSGGDSAHSQQELIVHFGLGNEQLEELSVTWPSGSVQSFENVLANDLVLIDEESGILAESLIETSFSHDAHTSKVRLTARSNYMGRTCLTLAGVGELAYDAASCTHSVEFDLESEVRSSVMHLRSARGAAWDLTDTADYRSR